METNDMVSNPLQNSDPPANGLTVCGSGTCPNATPLGRSVPKPCSDNSVRKRSRSIFNCLMPSKFRKSRSFTQLRQESPREAPTIMEPWISTIDSENLSSSVSTLTIGDNLSGDPLEHALNLRSVRPLMSCAQFTRHRNFLLTRMSEVPMRETQNCNDVEGHHRRCHNHIEMELQAMSVNRDESNLNRTAPVLPEEVTLTMDESKRELRASQEFLANRHFPSRKGKELGDRATTKRKDAMTMDGIAVHASDLFDDEDRERTKSSETARQESMERPISDFGESRGFIILSELFQNLGRAIEFLGQKEVLKQEEMANEIAFAKMVKEQEDCLRAQLVKTREMIKQRLTISSSVSGPFQKGSQTVSPISIKARCACLIEPSPRPLTNSQNFVKCDCGESPAISPIHSRTSTSRNGTSHRAPPNSTNQDGGSPGSEKLQRTLRLCSPNTGTAERFTVDSPTNCDIHRTSDAQRQTRESTPRRPFGNLSVTRNRSLDEMPVGVDNSNLGTTCYINAGMQLLCTMPEILCRVEEGVQFWISEGSPDLEACVAYKNFMENRAREYSKLNKERDAIKNSPIADMMFKIYPDKFKAFHEADCVEFVTLLLQKIHEELGEEHSPSVLFTGAQRRFRSRVSRAAGREDDGTNSFTSPPSAKEEFNVVPLHFTARHRVLEDCFDSYATKEPSSDGEFVHWCKFEELPSLLLVHVQSYDESKPIPKKALRQVPINEILQFREEWMYKAPGADDSPLPSEDSFGIIISDDLEKDSASEKVLYTPPRYLLRGVVFHDGQRTTTGHYTAAVFLHDKHRRRVWYYCDDQHVKVYSRKELNQRAKASQVTLLLYERDS